MKKEYLISLGISFAIFLLFAGFCDSVLHWISYYLLSLMVYSFLNFRLSKLDSYTPKLTLYYGLGFNVIIFFTYLGYIFSSTQATIHGPFLFGDASGDFGYHNLAQAIAKSNSFEEAMLIAARTSQVGFPLLLGSLYRYVYNDVSIGYFLMQTVGLLILFFTAFTYDFLKKDKVGILTVMSLAIVTPQIISQGIYIFKDGLVTLGILFVVLGLLFSKTHQLKALMYFLLGVVFLILFRTQLIIFVPLAIVLNTNLLNRRTILMLGGLSLLIAVVLGSGIELRNLKVDPDFFLEQTVNNTAGNEWSDKDDGITGVIGRTILEMPIVLRLIFLPVSGLLQYFLPFNIWKIDHIHPWYVVYINMNLILWLIVGPLIIFSFLRLKKHAEKTAKNIFRLGGVMYLLIALIYGGVMPRYYQPFMPFLLMSAGSVSGLMNKVSQEKVKFRYFRIFYFLMLSTAVLIYVLLSFK